MKTRTALLFCIALCTALYLGKPKDPKYKKPKELRMLTKGINYFEMDTIYLPEHKNHSKCEFYCPLLR